MAENVLTLKGALMQSREPIIPTFSPSEGEKEKPCGALIRFPIQGLVQRGDRYSLAPSDGERVRVRGNGNGTLTG